MSDTFIQKNDFNNVQQALHLFEPCAWEINAGAEKLRRANKTTSKIISATEYLTNPIDRFIQVLATPMFCTISLCHQLHMSRLEKKKFWLVKVALAPLALVSSVILTTTTVAGCALIHTGIHLFPFKAIDAFANDRPKNFFIRRREIRERATALPFIIKKVTRGVTKKSSKTREWTATTYRDISRKQSNAFSYLDIFKSNKRLASNFIKREKEAQANKVIYEEWCKMRQGGKQKGSFGDNIVGFLEIRLDRTPETFDTIPLEEFRRVSLVKDFNQLFAEIEHLTNECCYRRLFGLGRNESLDTLDNRFRIISLRVHPDRNSNEPERSTLATQRLLAARNFLSR